MKPIISRNLTPLPYLSLALSYKAIVYTQVKLPPLIPPMLWGETIKIQFPPLYKGRVREG
jgi:hypothetical protein